MSLFDKNNLSTNPVTAQGLREIIKSRYSLEGDTLYLVKSDGEKIGKGIKINSTMITETNGMMNVVHI